jgi:peroxiredoxin
MAVETPICDFGWQAPDFRLEGIDGRSHGLAEVRGPNGTLVMFICNHCPYVKAVIDRIVSEVAALEGHGIGAVAIMSNDTEAYPDDSFDNMKRFAARHRFNFPYLIDRTQEVARAYDAVCTPDFFGFDKDLGLQYRGRLDESKRDAVPGSRRELYEAMVQVAETGAGPRDQIPSMGCSIKWRAHQA